MEIGDWAGAIGNTAAALLGVGGSTFSQTLSYRDNKRLMEKQQAWQEKMSNTALQRGINDAKKAGINPIVIAGNNGASTPTSGLNSVQTPDLGAGMNTAVSNMIANKQANSQIELQHAQTNLFNEQSLTESTQQRINIAKAIEQEGLNSFLNERQKAELKKLGSEIINLDINSAWMKAKQNAIASEIDLNTATAAYNRRRTGGHSIWNADTWIEPIGQLLDNAGKKRNKTYGR